MSEPVPRSLRGRLLSLAAMLAGAMMLEFLGQAAAATALEQAVLGVLAEGKVVTPDLGGGARTDDVTEAVVGRLR